VTVPDYLDKQYYIDMAENRIKDFLSKDKVNAKPKSEIKSINLVVKTEVEEFLENDESDSIFEFIHSLKSNVTINKTQFEILTKLGYFNSYAKPKKILRCHANYLELINRKNFKLKDVEKLECTNEELTLCAERKSDTQYLNVNTEQLLKLMFNRFENEGYTLKEKLQFEVQYYGRAKFTNDKFPRNVYYVQSMTLGNDKTKPRFELYSLKTGELIKTRIKNSELYMTAPITDGHIIKCKFTEQKMNKFIDGKWTASNDKEKILTEYEVY
jgi:hypothetical protein